MKGISLTQGNEACAHGALAAGCRFYAGYPITPSSDIAEEMARLLPAAGGVFVQMEDEIASLAAVLGASVAGSRAMTATSGPGFSLMQEHIGFAAMTEIPCVVVDVMRAGPSTGLPTSPAQGDVMQTRWGTHGDRAAIVLAPASVREVFDLTVRAFDLAERFRNPVIVVYDEVIGHMREGVELPAEPKVVARSPGSPPGEHDTETAPSGGVAPRQVFGDGHRFHLTGLTHDQLGFPTTDPETAGDLVMRLSRKVEDHADDISEVEGTFLEDADVVVFAYGIVARAAREAVERARRRGIRAGLLRPVTLWPFPSKEVARVAQEVERVVVAEMNLGQMLSEVERAVAGAVDVVGHFRADGETITPSELLSALEARPHAEAGRRR